VEPEIQTTPSALTFGEVLFDHFGDEKRPGGAPFNVACHIRAFGTPCTFFSRVGQDPDGKDILTLLRDLNFPQEGIQIDPDYPTGQVLVTVDHKGIPSYDILTDQAYDYLEYTPTLSRLVQNGPGLICFGTLLQRTPRGAGLTRLIWENRPPKTFLLYDVNLRKGQWSKEHVLASLHASNGVKWNDEEEKIIAECSGYSGPLSDFPYFALSRYDLTWIARTRGSEGSDLFLSDRTFSISPERDVPIMDTVGAGDAYTAVLAVGILRRWKFQNILHRATEFASRICGIRGAIPHDPSIYHELMSRWEESCE